MAYTVKAVAGMAGVTVRTLHHYDEIGLLQPATVSAAGYRLYSDADLERLQHILFFRELGFSLQDIKGIVTSPAFDAREALRAHRRLLTEQQRRLKRLVRSVDRALEALEGGTAMTTNERFDGFDTAKLEEYREEARQRWGKETVDASWRKWDAMTKEEQKEMVAQGREHERRIAALMDRGPSDPAVQDLIHLSFRSINDNFYECTPEIFRGLGDMYANDSRFTAHYEEVRPGMAAFMRDAMHVYCDRLEGKA